ncbi:MAG: hypothetical protein JNM28_03230 [Armatimonadetes bacterium]|nr:hypothetical protein [Armatimonadota bacterium]MBS1711187.1 hypothetical protein [Armatimonadota bacterium]MBX3108861.1 hypothetical protein [Fimbriimonadaceae bacterium]
MANRPLIPPKLATYGSSAILTLLTLAVFAYSKDQGPESAVRRYHVAVSDGDRSAAKALESGSGAYSDQMAGYVRTLLANSESVSLGRIRPDGRKATVDVIYRLSRGRGIVAVRYVVVKPDLKWRVDLDETVSLLNRMNRFE